MRPARALCRSAVAAVALTAAIPLGAQQAASAPCRDVAILTDRPTPAISDSASRRDRTIATGRPSVVVLAEVHAAELRFTREPSVRVRLCGGLDSVRVVERRNLPSPIVVGRTYRDVHVAVEVVGRVAGDCLVERLRTGSDSARPSPCTAPVRAPRSP